MASRPLVASIYRELLRRLRGRPTLVEATRHGEGIRGIASEDLSQLGSFTAPAALLVLLGHEERRETGDAAVLQTTWGVILLLPPPPAGTTDADLDERELLIDEVKLALHPAALDDEDGEPLTDELLSWQRVDAQQPAPDNAYWRTSVAFTLSSPVAESTREAIP